MLKNWRVLKNGNDDDQNSLRIMIRSDCCGPKQIRCGYRIPLPATQQLLALYPNPAVAAANLGLSVDMIAGILQVK